MRRFIVVAASILLLTSALARAEEPVRMVPLSAAVPMPRPVEVEVSRFRVVAIGAGAVVGMIAANVISGGMITPFLAGVSLAMPAEAAAVVPVAAAAGPAVAAVPVVAATSATMMAVHAGIIVAGSVIGAAVGNWLYGT